VGSLPQPPALLYNMLSSVHSTVYSPVEMWTFGRTADRLSRIEEEIKGLRTVNESLNSLPLQWENTLDLLTKMAGRINARAKVLESASTPENDEVQVANPQPTQPTGLGTHARLVEARSRSRGLLHR